MPSQQKPYNSEKNPTAKLNEEGNRTNTQPNLGRGTQKENTVQKPAKSNSKEGFYPRMDEEEKESGLITGSSARDYNEGSTKPQKPSGIKENLNPVRLEKKDLSPKNHRDDDDDEDEGDDTDEDDTEGRRSSKNAKNVR
ncbi:MAG: hypothetical protein WC222_00945 [Parachlamydiales bacterium]|jgi:hypothetical protein